ncbi:30S ribosomal protein S3 [Mollicutes bacterium LVI A0078]|nr:30S ribosomal protein S3 [Mollicutes bacterium LVI A0075]WOO90264.1 30S ribosomal protein S3 [Mollicutes bacterium LVI A0078]
MGQKVNPNGLRLGINRDWQSTWYAEKDYAKFVNLDENIRVELHEMLKDAFVSKIQIERKSDKDIVVKIVTARPGIVLGQGGENIKGLEAKIKKINTGLESVKVEVVEVENADLDAQIVADMIARQLENRGNFRIVQKRAIKDTMRAGAKGIKTKVSGRLGGVDMARSEGYTEGNVPLHTLRAEIDYALSEAATTYGRMGVKVWIYKGEVLRKDAN